MNPINPPKRLRNLVKLWKRFLKTLVKKHKTMKSSCKT